MDLRGHLELLVLAAIARTGPSHGYGLITAMRDGSDGEFDLPEGTVYPALHRLERLGLVTSDWDHSGARGRRVYSLTGAGREALSSRRAQWRSFSAAVERFAL